MLNNIPYDYLPASGWKYGFPRPYKPLPGETWEFYIEYPQKEIGEGEIRMTKEEALMLAFGDAIDAIGFAAAEGFEWPSNPFTSNIKYVIKKYGAKINACSTYTPRVEHERI